MAFAASLCGPSRGVPIPFLGRSWPLRPVRLKHNAILMSLCRAMPQKRTPSTKMNSEDNNEKDASKIGGPETTLSLNENHPPPVPALELTVTPRHLVIGTSSLLSKTQCCATLTARDLPTDDGKDARAPIDIVVALDVSYSMRGEKLQRCKESLAVLIKSLLPADRFGLVTFSDTAEVEVPIQYFSQDQKEDAIVLVNSLEVRKLTNISDALCLATRMLREASCPNAVRTVFLLTDGVANCGAKTGDDIAELVKSRYVVQEAPSDAIIESETSWEVVSQSSQDDESETPPEELPSTNLSPITILCFGYGSDHDSKMLLGISQAFPSGSYYFVQDEKDVFPAFGDALGGVFSVVAQNISLVLFVPADSRRLGAKIVNVYHPNKVKRNDSSYAINLGDLYAEEKRDIIFEVALANPPDTIDYWITHVKVSLSYVDTLTKEFVSYDEPVPCDIARIDSSSVISASNQHVKIQWLRVRATETFREADTFATMGNMVGAQVAIDNMVTALLSSPDDVVSDELVKQLLRDLQCCKDGLGSYNTYVNYGSHAIRNALRSHGSQRCMDSLGGNRRNVYRGRHKVKAIQHFQNHAT